MFFAVMFPPLLARLPRHSEHFETNSIVLLLESNWARTSGIILFTWLTIWVSCDIFKISFSAEKIPNFSSFRWPWSSLWKSLKISSVCSLCFWRYSSSLWLASSWTWVYFDLRFFQMFVSSMLANLGSRVVLKLLYIYFIIYNWKLINFEIFYFSNFT